MFGLSLERIIFILVAIIVLYVLGRRWLKTKIKCVFIFPDRRQRIAFLKPNEYGMLAYRDGLYIYEPKNILYSTVGGGIELVPTLTFHYSFPSSIDMWELRPSDPLTPQMLAEAWNDKSLKEFIQAQESIGAMAQKPGARWVIIIIVVAVAALLYYYFGDSLAGGLTGESSVGTER